MCFAKAGLHSSGTYPLRTRREAGSVWSPAALMGSRANATQAETCSAPAMSESACRSVHDLGAFRYGAGNWEQMLLDRLGGGSRSGLGFDRRPVPGTDMRP